MEAIIKNATVITNRDDEAVLYHAQVNISGGVITYAGQAGSAPDMKAERVIDAADKVVMPGFFNLHSHVPMTLFRGYADDLALQEWLYEKIFPAEDKLTDEMAYWATMASLCEFAASGVVCFNEMYSNMDAIADAVYKSGFRAVLGRGVVSPSPEAAEAKIKEALDCFDSHHGNGRIKVFMSPHAQYTVDEKTLSLLAGHAKRCGTGVHVHVSETKREHDDCVRKTGKTPVRLFEDLGLLDVPFVGAHCVWVDEEDIRILAEHGATVASCPRSNLKLASGVAPLAKMRRAGVNVALGTDSAASNNMLSILGEMTLASFLQKGITLDPQAIPAAEAIRMATLNGARALGIDSGVVQAGKNADLIMLDNGGLRYHPRYDALASVVYASSEADICMTMIGGDIVYEDGVCSFADTEEIKDRLESYARAILA
jgi:5-methylthioadenosine/S-adenosylhomocysteine deaminase